MFTLVVRAFGTDRWVAGLLDALAHNGPGAVMAAVMGSLVLSSFVLDAFSERAAPACRCRTRPNPDRRRRGPQPRGSGFEWIVNLRTPRF